MIFNTKKSSVERIFADFGYVFLTILSNEQCWCGFHTFFSTSKSNFIRLCRNRLFLLPLTLQLKNIACEGRIIMEEKIINDYWVMQPIKSVGKTEKNNVFKTN